MNVDELTGYTRYVNQISADKRSVDDLNDDKVIVDYFTWYHQTRKKVGGKKRNHYLGRKQKSRENEKETNREMGSDAGTVANTGVT